MQRPVASGHTDIEPPAPDDGRIVEVRERQLRADWNTSLDCLGCAVRLDVSEPHLCVVVRLEADVARRPGPWDPEVYVHDGACLGAWVRE